MAGCNARNVRCIAAAPPVKHLRLALFQNRRVPRFWFALSALLRRLGLSGIVSLLPGVQRDPGDPNRLLVDPRVARYLVVQVFHLFGYRRLRPVGGKLAFSRRWAARDSGRVRPRSS